jgi:hypothetical protein
MAGAHLPRMATSDSPTPEYREVHGLRLFRCGPYAVTLSTKACAARHLEARQATGRDAEKLVHCRSCPIGAKHAGQELVHFSRHYDKPICRVDWPYASWESALSIAAGVVFALAVIAADAPRITYQPQPGFVATRAIAFTFFCDGEPRQFEGRVTNRAEAVLQCLRTNRGALTFGFSGEASHPGAGDGTSRAVQQPNPDSQTVK